MSMVDLTKLAVLLPNLIDRGIGGQLKRCIVIDLDIWFHHNGEDTACEG